MYLVVEGLEAKLDRIEKKKKKGTKREEKKRREILLVLQLKLLTKFVYWTRKLKEERRKRSKTSFNFYLVHFFVF